jgi:hypothetical protein
MDVRDVELEWPISAEIAEQRMYFWVGAAARRRHDRASTRTILSAQDRVAYWAKVAELARKAQEAS